MAAITDEQIAELQERARILAAGLGLDEGFTVPPDVRRLAAEGQSVQAIRELRRGPHGRGMSLLAAKRMVDALD